MPKRKAEDEGQVEGARPVRSKANAIPGTFERAITEPGPFKVIKAFNKKATVIGRDQHVGLLLEDEAGDVWYFDPNMDSDWIRYVDEVDRAAQMRPEANYPGILKRPKKIGPINGGKPLSGKLSDVKDGYEQCMVQKKTTPDGKLLQARVETVIPKLQPGIFGGMCYTTTKVIAILWVLMPRDEFDRSIKELGLAELAELAIELNKLQRVDVKY